MALSIPNFNTDYCQLDLIVTPCALCNVNRVKRRELEKVLTIFRRNNFKMHLDARSILTEYHAILHSDEKHALMYLWYTDLKILKFFGRLTEILENFNVGHETRRVMEIQNRK